MKRFLLIPLMVVLVSGLIFGGCAAPAPAPAPIAPTPGPEPTPIPTPAAPAPAKPEVIELSFNHHMPPAKGRWEATDPTSWGIPIEEATKGRVKVKYYAGAVLSSAVDAYDACAGGICDLSWFWHSYEPGCFPLLSVFNLPFLTRTSEGNMKVLNSLLDKFPQIIEHHVGVKIMWLDASDGYFITSKKPIRTLEDFAGMKVKCAGEIARAVERLGATPLLIPMPQVYSSMEKGVIDSALMHWTPLKSFKLNEVAGYAGGEYFGPGTHGVVMNLDTWNSLPPDIQEAIEGVNKWRMRVCGQHLDKNSQATRDWWIEEGKEYILLSPEEEARWEELCEPLYDEWVAEIEAKGLPGKEVLDEVLRIVAEYK